MSRLYAIASTAGKRDRTLCASDAVQTIAQTEQFRIATRLRADGRAEVWVYPLREREPVLPDGRLIFAGRLDRIWAIAHQAALPSLWLPQQEGEQEGEQTQEG